MEKDCFKIYSEMFQENNYKSIQSTQREPIQGFYEKSKC